MEQIRTLFTNEADSAAPALSEELRSVYGGDLRFPIAPPGRPYVFANFVTTLDGVVTFGLSGEPGGSISGGNPGDQFIMGLLRASADAVMIASGTAEAAESEHLWIPEYIYPPGKSLYAEYRKALGKPEHPTNVVVTGSGNLSLDRAIFHTPGVEALILTTEPGRARLAFAGAEALASTRIVTHKASDGRISPSAILKILKQDFGISLLLHEGGPTFFAEFVACGLADELFLTIAPQIAGRSGEHRRPGIVSGLELTPSTAPWLKLVSVKQAEDHLYLRYRR